MAVLLAACSPGPGELRPGDCVEVVGAGSSQATDRLVGVECDTAPGDGIFRVVWLEEAADTELLTVTRLAASCDGPTLLPDADMLAAGDATVVCFEPLE